MHEKRRPGHRSLNRKVNYRLLMLIIIVVVGGHILLYAQTPRMDEVEKRGRKEGREEEKRKGEGKGGRQKKYHPLILDKIPPPDKTALSTSYIDRPSNQSSHPPPGGDASGGNEYSTNTAS